MNIYHSALDLIGNTPLIELHKIEEAYGLKARILAKPEAMNPAGSAKDRVALHMLDKAEEDGRLKPGSVIIEPTSGNTGIGLAMVGSIRGYRTIIVMPDNMSKERILTMRAYGAEVVLTPGGLGMAGSIEEAKRLAAEIPDSFIPDQFGNPDNTEAHYLTTGPEIVRDTDGKADYFVAGIGTGGTITGTSRYLKENIRGIRIIGVEPANSPLLNGGKAGAHGLQGIGANFIPDVLDRSIPDEVMDIYEEDAYRFGRELCAKEGLLVGITSGAALAAAVAIAKRPEAEGRTIVVLLPDTGSRYLSTPMFEE